MASVFVARPDLVFSPVDEAVAAIENGVPVIVVDAEERENEGDFVVAAEKMTPSLAHFMMTVGRGLMCIPVSTETAERIGLERIPCSHQCSASPAFAVPIDYRGCESGVSPTDRALTANQVVNRRTRPADFLRPGHMFPLLARAGGVLERPGHTEATVDLIQLAGCNPVGVLCEVCSSNGKGMARRDELLSLGAKHGLPVVTIESLVELREG